MRLLTPLMALAFCLCAVGAHAGDKDNKRAEHRPAMVEQQMTKPHDGSHADKDNDKKERRKGQDSRGSGSGEAQAGDTGRSNPDGVSSPNRNGGNGRNQDEANVAMCPQWMAPACGEGEKAVPTRKPPQFKHCPGAPMKCMSQESGGDSGDSGDTPRACPKISMPSCAADERLVPGKKLENLPHCPAPMVCKPKKNDGDDDTANVPANCPTWSEPLCGDHEKMVPGRKPFEYRNCPGTPMVCEMKKTDTCPAFKMPECTEGQERKPGTMMENGCMGPATCVDIKTKSECPVYETPKCGEGMKLVKGQQWFNGCVGPDKCVMEDKEERQETCPKFATPECGRGMTLVPAKLRDNGCMSAPRCVRMRVDSYGFGDSGGGAAEGGINANDGSPTGY